METLTVAQLIEQLSKIENKQAKVFGYCDTGDDGVGNLPITYVKVSDVVEVVFFKDEDIY